ncbi:hypothetical protein PMAYCL1PPCAC_15499 [Pristionchus mayeri]|uniref:Uncharacterized protein n=1 Tax=Pristionchus mayeri TaxID=1317129 RepID=A0AAN5CJ41_9BILA|nr:hypothetical protein PMAYCL1PPCAC_15499 [Pristionchus mayeri]
MRTSDKYRVFLSGQIPNLPHPFPSRTFRIPASTSRAAVLVEEYPLLARPDATSRRTTRIFCRRCSLELMNALSIPSPRCTSVLLREETIPPAAEIRESTLP